MMLFRHLGVDTYVLADEPLNKLIAHLQIDQHLDEMYLFTPIDREDKVDSARKQLKAFSHRDFRFQRCLEGWGSIGRPFIVGSEHGRIAD